MAASVSLLPPGDVPVSALSRAQLINVLTDTVGDLERLELMLDADGVADARRLRTSLVGQVRDHVLPRLADAELPAVVVVGGSTGAGKSTLVNSVLGAEVSDAGVLRPTTRTPVLVVNPEDIKAFTEHPLAQVCLTVVSDAVPSGLALVDASALDSVHEANRTLAVRLLEAADLWLFITTAARYGDHTPWSTLEDAAGRRTPIGVVLNRVPARILPEVRRDLVERLEGLGLAESPFFVVPDVGPHEGLLPESSVAPLRDWLRLLAGRHRAAGLVRRTGRSTWAGLRADRVRLADDVDAQDDAARRLESATQALLTAPVATMRAEIDAGSWGQGAPATRWLSLASAGGPLASMAALETGRRLRAGLFGRRTKARTQALGELAADAVEVVADRLHAALVSLAGQARELWTGAGVPESVATGRLGTVRDGDLAARWAHDQVRARLVPAGPPRGMSADGVGHLLVAAAVGVDGALEAARGLGLAEAVAQARDALVQTLAAELAAIVPAGAARGLAPDPALAAALRLRAGELSPFVRPGASA